MMNDNSRFSLAAMRRTTHDEQPVTRPEHESLKFVMHWAGESMKQQLR